MTQEKREFEDWLSCARQAKRVALLAHISPDGDTVGSTLALRLAFLALGKQAKGRPSACRAPGRNVAAGGGQRGHAAPGECERRGL